MANGVSFDKEPTYSIRSSNGSSLKGAGFITTLVVKLGLAKTEKEATIVLVVFAIICVILSIIAFIAIQPRPHPLSKQQLEADMARMRGTTNTSISTH